MQKAKSAIQCIETNDFEEAKSRYDNARIMWVRHWFDTCYTIAKNNRHLFKQYVFDTDEARITTLSSAKINKRNGGEAYVYLIKMYDLEDNFVYLKGGKTNNLERRFYELGRQHYKREDLHISRVEEVKSWCLPSEHLAESFEQLLHAYFAKFLENTPNDRWTPIDIAEDDYAELERRYQIIKELG